MTKYVLAFVSVVEGIIHNQCLVFLTLSDTHLFGRRSCINQLINNKKYPKNKHYFFKLTNYVVNLTIKTNSPVPKGYYNMQNQMKSTT